jgi:hypothetical protein
MILRTTRVLAILGLLLGSPAAFGLDTRRGTSSPLARRFTTRTNPISPSAAWLWWSDIAGHYG